MRNLFLLTLLFLGSFSLVGQNAISAITKINAKYASVKDYKVQVEVKASIPMIRILPSKATIYFKQKNKFKIE
jgi:outer membrane lipoprotein-sorting protein